MTHPEVRITVAVVTALSVNHTRPPLMRELLPLSHEHGVGVGNLSHLVKLRDSGLDFNLPSSRRLPSGRLR